MGGFALPPAAGGRYGPDLGDPAEVIRRAVAAGVAWMVCVGTDLESSHQALTLAGTHREVLASVGLHPHDASQLPAVWGMLEPLIHADRVVAIGETGLDHHYMHSSADEQEASFRTHIRLAKRVDRALVVHTREAWDETFRLLEEEGLPERVVIHCFSGGADEARRAVDLGAYVSFSGIVSFPKADDVRAAVAVVPDDRLLVETDAPFLAPAPHRGRPNEPAYVSLVGAAVAAAKGVDATTVERLTRENAARVYGLAPA
ncbi:MAG: TatD family hydrolase [Acidimicrobiia bacterium]|nr:TatD family hydrolase [Acidimicrobiia bacterium]